MRQLGLNIVYSLLFALLYSCGGKTIYPTVQVMGHGGNGLSNPSSFYHDNSLESIHLALSKTGCDGIEVDVQLSASGTLWLFHDEKVSDELSLNGCIAELSDAELENAYYKTIHKEKIIRLSDLPVDLLQGRTIFLDLRHANSCSNSIVDYSKVESQLMEFRENHSNSKIVVFSQYLPWLMSLKLKNFEVMTEIQSISEYNTLVTEFPELDGIVSRNKNISKEEVSLIQSEQRKVVLFDMRSASGSRKALKKVPNSVLTDDLNTTLIERNL